MIFIHGGIHRIYEAFIENPECLIVWLHLE